MHAARVSLDMTPCDPGYAPFHKFFKGHVGTVSGSMTYVVHKIMRSFLLYCRIFQVCG